MRRLFLPLLLLACAAMHPACGQTQADYQAQAVAKHPELKVPTSPLSKAMAEEIAKRRKDKSTFFMDADWPLRLADELALTMPPVYKLADKWPNANGLVKIIVIDPADATRERLKLLGKSFHEDIKKNADLMVRIYDDPKAARDATMGHQNKKRSMSELAFSKEHDVATYHYNRDTGGEYLVLKSNGKMPDEIELVPGKKH